MPRFLAGIAMSGGVFSFDLAGERVLGFDTGLKAREFARAKMAALAAVPGFIVYPEGDGDSPPAGRVETWMPGGVAERGTMIVWGPCFPGEELTGITNDSARKDEAMNALRCWLRAGMVLANTSSAGEAASFPSPAGAFIVRGERRGRYPEGTVFFPPARLLRRTLEAEGNAAVTEAERWTHPGLEGGESASFSAGAMLYRIFCGVPPFPENEKNELRQNIREAAFVPPGLAAPGLDPEMSETIARAMGRFPRDGAENRRPSPEFIYRLINPPSARTVSSWFKPLDDEERLKIRVRREQYGKKNALAVKTRRFLAGKTAILKGVLIAAAALTLIIRGYVRHRAELPTTKGMNPVEVAETYYGAFDALDHGVMAACARGRAGKNDIEMAVNLFVINRARQAYESSGDFFMTAREWVEAGRPATEKTVFGITDLKIKMISEGETSASLEADYILWMPGSYFNDKEETPRAGETSSQRDATTPLPPGGMATKDRLRLAFEKDAWRITEIERESAPADL